MTRLGFIPLMIISAFKIYLKRTLPFFLLFLVYGFLTYPSIYWGDSGEFSYVATFLGIPHPTGYPLYIQLLRLFSYFPFGSPYFLHNLFSALFATLAMGILFKLCLQITGNATTAWVATFFFALSPTFLNRAGLAEVYPLQVFIGLLVAALGVAFLREGDIRKLWMIAFLLGLGMSHHLITIMYFPAFLFLLVVTPKKVRNFKLFLGIGLFAVIGVLPYLFIALRTHLSPDFSYPSLFGITMSSLKDWVWLLSGEIFRTEMTSFDLGQHIEDFGFFFYLLFKDYYWLGGVIGLLGLVKGLRAQPKPALFLGLLFLVQTLFFVHYQVPDIHEFYIMSFCLWAPWFAEGLHQIGRILIEARPKNKKVSIYFFRSLFFLLLIPLWSLFQFYKPVALDQTPLAYVHKVLSYPQQNFTLFTTYTGRDIFRLFQFLTPVRPDITVVDYGLDLLKERSHLVKSLKHQDETFKNQLHLKNKNLMETRLTQAVKEKPVFVSRDERFFGDQFLQKKVSEAFYSISLKPWPAQLEALPPSVQKSDLIFGSSLRLLAYTLDPVPLVEGELLTLHLYWKRVGKITGDITCLVLFQNKEADQSTSPVDRFYFELTLGYGWQSPESWPEGKIIEETYQIAVPTLRPNRYTISLSLFDKKVFDRTPIKKLPANFSPTGETNIVDNPELSHYWDNK
jgi:hypothetical protein